MIIHTPTNLALQKSGIYVRADAGDWQSNWPLHTHQGLEIYYFIRGNANYIIGEDIYELKPGDMLLFKGEAIHRVNPMKDVPYIRSYVNFMETFLQDGIQNEMFEKLISLFKSPGGMLIRWSPEEREELEQLFRIIHLENKQEAFGYEFMLKTYLLQMLVKIYRKSKYLVNSSSPHQQSQMQTNVKRILQYINHNYTENTNLTDLARTLHLNKYYICHCFKEATGYTVHNYLMSKRIEEAKKLLQTTDESVGGISEKVGFQTLVHFSRSFKQFAGVSPQNYRKLSMGE